MLLVSTTFSIDDHMMVSNGECGVRLATEYTYKVFRLPTLDDMLCLWQGDSGVACVGLPACFASAQHYGMWGCLPSG